MIIHSLHNPERLQRLADVFGGPPSAELEGAPPYPVLKQRLLAFLWNKARQSAVSVRMWVWV